MRKIFKCLTYCALLLIVEFGCSEDGKVSTTTTGAKGVILFNCTVDNGSTESPSGRAFEIWAKPENGEWTDYGLLGASLGPATDCRDEAHTAAAVTVDFGNQAGNWEVWAIKVHNALDNEGSCTSTQPTDPGACKFTLSFHQDASAEFAKRDMTENGVVAP